MFRCLPLSPLNVRFQRHEAPSAGTRSGTACSRQPNTTSGSIWPMMCRAQTAAGYGAFNIEPSGAVTVNGDSEPALLGTSGETTQLNPKQV